MEVDWAVNLQHRIDVSYNKTSIRQLVHLLEDEARSTRLVWLTPVFNSARWTISAQPVQVLEIDRHAQSSWQ